MKKGLMALVVAAVMLLLTGCGIASSNQELYERAQLYLGGNDYEAAAALFMQLGEYGDSADYALYAKSLLAWQDGDLTLARHGLEALHPFKSTGRYLAYLDALDAEHAGNMADALARYEALGTFGDSPTRAQVVRERMKEEQAEAQELAEAQEQLDDEDDPEDISADIFEDVPVDEEAADAEALSEATDAPDSEENPEATQAPNTEESPDAEALSEATEAPDSEEIPEATQAPHAEDAPTTEPLSEATEAPDNTSSTQAHDLRTQLRLLARAELARRHAEAISSTPEAATP